MQLLKYFFTKQFLLFLFVGGLAALLNWLSRIIFSYWLQFSYAVMFAYGVGVTVAFILNSIFVFKCSVEPLKNQIISFAIINLAFLPVVWFSSIMLNNYLISLNFIKYPKETAHGLAVCLPSLVTFLLYKFFAFKESYYEK